MSAAISMTLETLPVQNLSWTCGVISATRLLRSYGHNVTVDQMKREIGQLKILGKEVDIGNTTTKIVNEMRAHDGGSVHGEFITFDYLRAVLASGKPVATLLYMGEQRDPAHGVDIPYLHWVVASGFDDGTREMALYRPEHSGRTFMDYSEFIDRWRWKDWVSVRADAWSDMGLAEAIRFNIYGAIDEVLGRNSAFWIDRVDSSIAKTERDLAAYHGLSPARNLPSAELDVKGTGVQNCNLVRAIHGMEDRAAHHFSTDKSNLRIELSRLQSTYHERRWRVWEWSCWGCRRCEFEAKATVHNTIP